MAALLAGTASMSSPGYAKASSCQAWPLPLDGTCAGVARRLFRETVADMGLSGDVVHDGVTMVSELAANTLHAQGNVEFDGSRQRPITGSPELWSYVRRCATGYELVCKIFDSQRGWKAGAPPESGPGFAGFDQRPRPAGRVRAVRRPLGPSRDPGPAGPVEGPGQGRVVRAAGARGPRR